MTPTRATYAPPAHNERLIVTELPTPTAATPDLLCWLWAGFPPKNGRLDIARAARALTISDSTLRRRIKDATAGQAAPTAMVTALKRRAILRGRGIYLWPPLDSPSRIREELQRREATRWLEAITLRPDPHSPVPERWTRPTTLYLVHYPAAKVLGVATGSTDDTARTINRHRGEIISQHPLDSRALALVAKYTVLAQVSTYRCLPPRGLVPTGRTETWRADAPDVDVAAVLTALPTTSTT